MKLIVAIWTKCDPKTGYEHELRVIESSHPRFVYGSRFDFGFLQVANREGYTVKIYAGDLAKNSA